MACDLISQNASQELPLYVTARDRYFADPEKFTHPDAAEDEALVFGAAGLVPTFTQVVFPIVTPIHLKEANSTPSPFRQKPILASCC